MTFRNGIGLERTITDLSVEVGLGRPFAWRESVNGLGMQRGNHCAAVGWQDKDGVSVTDVQLCVGV